MPYRKFRADYLFTGIDLLSSNSVLVTDEKGKVEDIINVDDAGEDVETLTGLLCPGFINAHCHIELSHLKDKIPENTGLTEFVYGVVTESHYPAEDIEIAIKLAVEEMIQNGIVAVGDICNNELSIASKNEAQLRFYNFIEVSGWNPLIAQERFEKSKAIYDKYIQNNKEASMVPHAPYSVSYPLWEKIAPFFSHKVVTIHNLETEDENKFFLEGKGDLIRMYEMMKIDTSFYNFPYTSSIQSYLKKMVNASSVMLVHNTFIKQDDLDYIFKAKPVSQLISFCLCPNANIYIENTLPPVLRLLDNGVNIVVGTDSLASNHQLDILEELKTISKNFPSVTMKIMLEWATLNGAKALQMENILGSFEKGKQPGIVLIENLEGHKLKSDSKAKRLL